MVLEVFFRALSDAVIPLDTPERRAQYRLNQFPRFRHMFDDSKRYRWDLLLEADPELLQLMLDHGIAKRSIDRMLKRIVHKI